MIAQYDKVRAVVRQRPSYRGRLLKLSAALLEGQEVALQAAYLMDEGDSYPNEWAMFPVDDEAKAAFAAAGLAWIASGDLGGNP